uniref:Peptidylprolyl isomerase n=1 Tax=Rhodosorus marinus TaxID=101924 RepID=A0A7S0G530_9RHOD|mmetsp:Transcript_7164/g.10642  ORF Transcript_7164/g.10642 Transcript_7164/m.10642 type:complete len:127 (+) Transcript_7164:117-497(+)
MMADPAKDLDDYQSVESGEGSEKAEEGIDSPGFTGEFLSVDEKIRLASIEKDKGNALFKAGKIEKAWKQYDVAFVNVFIGKEEWASLNEEQRHAINAFKCPCHLNRGLCRLKLGHMPCGTFQRLFE